MADDEHVAVWCPSQNRLHPPHDPRLGSDGRLPTGTPIFGLAKEGINHDIEFGNWQDARRRAIVFVHGLP